MAERAALAASEYVYKVTGSQFSGACTAEFSPPCTCIDKCKCMFSPLDLRDHVSFRRELLRDLVVTVNAVEIPAENNWVFRDGRYFVPLTDGALDPYPTQDFHKSPGTDGTWTIRYTYGREPSELAINAAEQVWCEIMRACLDLPCDVPRNAIAVSRDGITVRLQSGFEGLPSVKAAISAHKARHQPSRIYDIRTMAHGPHI